jgi:hypothetical protein
VSNTFTVAHSTGGMETDLLLQMCVALKGLIKKKKCHICVIFNPESCNESLLI